MNSVGGIVPAQPGRPSQFAADMGAFRDGHVTYDMFNTSPSTDGPHRFINNQTNPITTHHIKVVNLDLAGVSPDQAEMHEMSMVFVLNMVREDQTERHVAMTLWQFNVFMQMMTQIALDVYRREEQKTDYRALSQLEIRRLIKEKPRLEILKFLSVRETLRMVQFLGVQFGNRYVNASSGPGIAVITSGSAEMRNVFVNHRTYEQDALWLLLKAREAGGPLALVPTAFRDAVGPLTADLAFIDMAGYQQKGAAIKIGHIADKSNPDMESHKTKLVAAGLQGTAAECHWAEANAPSIRVVLCTLGIKMLRT